MSRVCSLKWYGHDGGSRYPGARRPTDRRARLRRAVRAAGAGTLGFAGAGLTGLSHRRRLSADPEGFRVVAYDLRGRGRSAESASDWSIDRYGEDLEAVLAGTCTGRNDVIVAGHSMGAMSVAVWARDVDVSARVRGAMLKNTGPSGLVLATKLIPALLPGAGWR